MNSNLRFSLGKAPFIRKADSGTNTYTIMRDFIIGLIPLIIFAWVKNGLIPMINGNCGFYEMIYPLLFCILGGFFTYAIEYIYYFLTKNKIVFTKEALLETHKKVMSSFAIIPGLLLAMIMPLNTPIWVLLISCIFATLIGKLLFGGFGCNIFNPALVGYLFFGVAYQGLTSFMNPTEIETIISGATPLGNFHNNILNSGSELIAPYGTIWDFLLGTIPGSIAETSAILCIISFAWLTYRKVINWKIPVIYVGTVFVLMYAVVLFDGRGGDLLYPLFHVLSGGLLFGAVFMATEPVTSPKTPNGKVIYGLGLGVLTVLMRLKSNAVEGVATSIMAMNIFTLIIDRICARVRAQKNVKKTLITYISIAVILIILSIYPISAVTKTTIKSSQNFDATSLSEVYKYNLTIDHQKFEVYTDQDGNITEITNDLYTSGENLETVKKMIKQNQRFGYVSKFEKDGENYKVNVNYLSSVEQDNRKFTVYFTFDKNYKLTSLYVIDKDDGGDYDESYNMYFEGYEYNGEIVEDVLPGIIVDNQNNLYNIKPISGATTTSNAFVEATKIAMNFIKDVKSGKVSFDSYILEAK